ncbi:MAG TPA: hypothetical protein ENG92_02460 [Thiolapillus brandeum]|uniref:Uncharacterized protein n=1 Tax=Thiolapillus brandeum TaxID=1076588 RepID=A0A831K2E1_9GAMM|nr:hypothetical protein [Thiolapillus brandeum]
MVTVLPESAGRWFIHHVKGNVLNNKHVLAREYLVRRSEEGGVPAEYDRRNPHAKKEKVEELMVQVQGLDQFKKEYR